MVAQPVTRVLLIEDNPGDAELVTEALASAEHSSFQVFCAETLLSGLDRLARGDIDVLLLDLSLPDSHGLDGLNAIRTHAPEVPVLVLTGLDSESLALQAVQSGAQDYLVKGMLQGPALARTIQHAVVRQRTQAAPRLESGREAAAVIGFLGAKGGVGSTTIACHLAMELKRQSGGRALLMDLDMGGNAIGFLMNVTGRYGILDASSDILHLDEDRWAKLTASGPGGLDVMQSAGPATAEEKLPKAERVKFVLRFVRTLYRWVVVDLGRLSPFSLQLAHETSSLYLVGTGDILGLSEAKSGARALSDAGFDRGRLSLLINQAAAWPGFSRNELEKVLGWPVEALLPDCRQDFERAFQDGKRLGESRKFQKQIAQLAVKAGAGPKDASGEKVHLPFLIGALRDATAGN